MLFGVLINCGHYRPQKNGNLLATQRWGAFTSAPNFHHLYFSREYVCVWCYGFCQFGLEAIRRSVVPTETDRPCCQQGRIEDWRERVCKCFRYPSFPLLCNWTTGAPFLALWTRNGSFRTSRRPCHEGLTGSSPFPTSTVPFRWEIQPLTGVGLPSHWRWPCSSDWRLGTEQPLALATSHGLARY